MIKQGLALASTAESITIYLCNNMGMTIGATHAPLRQCREIYTEKKVLVGWFIPEAKIAVLNQGKIHMLVFVLPDGQRQTAVVKEFGLPQDALVAPGALIELDNMRVLHPTAQPIQVSAMGSGKRR